VWVPVTKLGRLVKEGKIGSMEEIFLFSLPVKEAEIIDFFLKDKLQDEVMKIMPVQKQSSAGQRTPDTLDSESSVLRKWPTPFAEPLLPPS
jgi:small subunit ribosomal protein S2e